MKRQKKIRFSMARPGLRSLSAAAGASLFWLGSLAAQEPESMRRSAPEMEPEAKPAIAAVRVENGPKVDGLLDDEVWALAPAAGPFYQSDSQRIGEVMTERTEFRVLYDNDNIYLGVWCFDGEPNKITARTMERDSSSIFSDDYIYIAIDTFHDLRNGYLFIVNPNGARRDELVTNNIFRNSDWDGIWVARCTIDEEGWKAEIAIPLKTLSFDPKNSTWGFNMSRTISRKVERGRWTGAKPHIHTYHVSQGGDITGLEGLKQGLGLEVSPYGVFRYRRGGSDTDLLGDFGTDARWRITPYLSATVSYNTDFAETEVDLRQLNFTRFPLFFPEKRAFFLEDGGVYEFGGLASGGRSSSGLSRPLIPFFSRRIGRSSAGQTVPIVTAGKLAGRVGKYNLGLTDVLLDSHDDLGVKNVFAGRVSRDVWEQSSVGVISTAGDPNSNNDNFLLGPDLRFRTSEFLGHQILEANVFGLGTYTGNGHQETDFAYGAMISYPNDLVRANVQYIEIGEDFNPALGFVRRRGVRGYDTYVSYNPRPTASRWIRQYHSTFSTEHFTDLHNRLDSAEYRVTPIWLELESGDDVWISVTREFDAPRQAFEILDGGRIPAGDYWWNHVNFGTDFASKRTFSGGPRISLGEFYEGERQQYSLELDYRPSKHVSLSTEYSFNSVQLPSGDFDAHITALRMLWNFNPDLVWAHLVQYDSLSETVGYNSRIQWEYRPGSKIFLVLNQNYLNENLSLKLQDTEVALKVGAVFRF